MIKVLFAAFEAAPFVKTGGLGDVAGSLPAAISTSAFDVRVILPKLSAIPEKYVKRMEFVGSFSVLLGWRNQYCGLFRLKYKGILYYFLDNEYYFKRDNVYGEFDDGERVAFFSKAILEFILHTDEFVPDIIHCNDWHTALVPVMLREQYKEIPEFERIKTVFTIHNLKFQGKYSDFVIGDICGLGNTPAAAQLISDENTANYLQGAVIYSDRITTVSPSYAEEIRMPYYGEGLDWLFNRRKDVLSGILNGIDYRIWNPAKDKKIAVNYDASSPAKKQENKLLLQKELGLEVNKDIPLFVIISRLTEQKGLDLVNYLLPKFQQRSMQLAVLGIGDKKYENAFLHYAGIDPQKFSASIEFNTDFGHRMYAGADVVLMPSRFEPCGLTQMIAMRYGALPLVRETGGLKDTVHEDNGFSFLNFNAHDMLYAVDCALDIWFNRKRRWRAMQKQAMTEDYSWKASAREYRKLYREII